MCGCVCPPEIKVRTPAHTKQLGWYVEFEFRVTHAHESCPNRRNGESSAVLDWSARNRSSDSNCATPPSRNRASAAAAAASEQAGPATEAQCRRSGAHHSTAPSRRAGIVRRSPAGANHCGRLSSLSSADASQNSFVFRFGCCSSLRPSSEQLAGQTAGARSRRPLQLGSGAGGGPSGLQASVKNPTDPNPDEKDPRFPIHQKQNTARSEKHVYGCTRDEPAFRAKTLLSLTLRQAVFIPVRRGGCWLEQNVPNEASHRHPRRLQRPRQLLVPGKFGWLVHAATNALSVARSGHSGHSGTQWTTQGTQVQQ